MKTRIPSFLVLASLLLLPGAALAASPVYTPPLPYYTGIGSFRCLAMNTGTKDVEAVTVDIVRINLGYGGTVLATTTETAFAGERVGIILSDLTGGPWVACRVTGLPKKSVTVTFQALDMDGIPVTTVTAA
jgi:hypothetical protein